VCPAVDNNMHDTTEQENTIMLCCLQPVLPPASYPDLDSERLMKRPKPMDKSQLPQDSTHPCSECLMGSAGVLQVRLGPILWYLMRTAAAPCQLGEAAHKAK
jgi:hypothetical protein